MIDDWVFAAKAHVLCGRTKEMLPWVCECVRSLVFIHSGRWFARAHISCAKPYVYKLPKANIIRVCDCTTQYYHYTNFQSHNNLYHRIFNVKEFRFFFLFFILWHKEFKIIAWKCSQPFAVTVRL